MGRKLQTELNEIKRKKKIESVEYGFVCKTSPYKLKNKRKGIIHAAGPWWEKECPIF